MEEEKKKKKVYCKPEMQIEEFTPNEYVSACWGVACSYNKANTYEETHYGKTGGPGGPKTWYQLGCSHDASHCGSSINQVIFDDNNDGIADRMKEIGTDRLGDLNCTIYTDGTYGTSCGVSSVKTGNYIYWTTVSGDRTWHHQGTVFATVDGHPNMS